MTLVREDADVETGKAHCPKCQSDGIHLTCGECRIVWCERGHIMVSDLYQKVFCLQVWDFSLHSQALVTVQQLIASIRWPQQ